MSDDQVKIDSSHVSDHFLKGKEGTFPIAQQIRVGGKTMIAHTDVDGDGNVTQSGFSKKV